MAKKFSPSAVDRWANCPASIAYDSTTSKEAEEGTKLHQIAATILSGGETESNYDVDFYVNYVKQQTLEPDTKLLIETKLDLNSIIDNCIGFADAIVHKKNLLHIIDLKTGYDEVPVVNNKQLILYAYGAYLMFQDDNIEEFKLTIVQPRLNKIDSWGIVKKELFEQIEVLKVKAKVANLQFQLPEKNRHYCPNALSCKFCSHAAHCDALAAYIAPENCTSMTAKLDKIPLLKVFIDATEKACYKMLEEGQTIDGYELSVLRQGAQQWLENAEQNIPVITNLGEEAFEKKLLSPAKMKKKVSKEVWNQLGTYITRAEPIKHISRIKA